MPVFALREPSIEFLAVALVSDDSGLGPCPVCPARAQRGPATTGFPTTTHMHVGQPPAQALYANGIRMRGVSGPSQVRITQNFSRRAVRFGCTGRLYPRKLFPDAVRSEPCRGARQESWSPESGERQPVQEVTVRKAVRSAVVTVLAFVVVAMPSVARADGRVALVVGNSTYAHIGRLPNPDNDARDISATLRRLGFEVTTELDVDRVELTAALRAFRRQSAGADVSLVFYAGHGIEMDGVNYLVPVDARLERDVDVRFETVTVDDLLVSMSGASLRLLILDACRNNPLARSMQRTAATRTVSGGSFADLNEDLLGDETLVAYAAAAGTTAADGRGRNSPYTTALLSHLETPLEIGLLFRRVRAQVLASTNGAQRPHEYHSLVGEHYLTRTLAGGASATVTAAVPAAAAPADPPPPDPAQIDVTELHIAALRQLAETGDAEAQTELGERYEDGRATWCRTMVLPCPGSVGRPTKAMRPGRSPLGSCTTEAAAWDRMMPTRSVGTAAQQNRATPARSTTSASCTARDVGSRRTTQAL